MRKNLLLLVPLLALSACTWGITQDDAARNVRTAWNGDVGSCHDLGKVTVSVMDHVGPVNRNAMTIREELEVMARNEAAKMHADTVKPLGEPTEGSQAWGVYQCGARNLAPVRSTAAPANNTTPDNAAPGNAQTFPVKGH